MNLDRMYGVLVMAALAVAGSCGRLNFQSLESGSEADRDTSPNGARPDAGLLDSAGPDASSLEAGLTDASELDATAQRPSLVKSSVGTFTIGTGTQQVSHSLGTTPTALVLWSSGSRGSGTFTPSTFATVGFTDANRVSRSFAMSSLDSSAGSEAARRIQDAAITFVKTTPEVMAEAEVAAWDSQSFTLNWTTESSDNILIHYLALGGDGLDSHVLDWQMPTTPATEVVSGIGFRPDSVLHANSGHGLTLPPPARPETSLTH